VASIKEIYNLFYRSKLNTSQALAEAESMELNEHQQLFVDFVKNAERGISN
jgi:acyl-[acyl carrier protein]--UDP-N-acetylglucosamine O-acyltransferase